MGREITEMNGISELEWLQKAVDSVMNALGPGEMFCFDLVLDIQTHEGWGLK